jgi:hypothetical protein
MDWLKAPGGGGVVPGGGGLIAGVPGGGGLAIPGGGDGVEPGQQQVDSTTWQLLIPPLMEISSQTLLSNRAKGGMLWPARQLPADIMVFPPLMAIRFINPNSL